MTNSFGFGGNNATAVVLSPNKVNAMIALRYGGGFEAYLSKREATQKAATAYAVRADSAELDVIYRFGEALIDEQGLNITKQGISIPGFAREIEFDLTNPWQDMRQNTVAD